MQPVQASTMQPVQARIKVLEEELAQLKKVGVDATINEMYGRLLGTEQELTYNEAKVWGHRMYVKQYSDKYSELALLRGELL